MTFRLARGFATIAGWLESLHVCGGTEEICRVRACVRACGGRCVHVHAARGACPIAVLISFGSDGEEVRASTEVGSRADSLVSC